MKKVLILVVGLALALACLTPGVLSASKETYVIGAFFSITGPNAPLGTPERDTALMVVDQINSQGGVDGHQLKIIIEDDASDPTNSVKAAKKLLEQDKVIALIGGTGTGNAAAVVSLAAQAKVAFMTVCAGTAGVTDPLSPWAFRTAPANKDMIGKLVDYLIYAKLPKVALLYDSNAYGTDARNILRALAPQTGINVAAEEAFNTKDTDFTIQLTKAVNSGAKAIIVWGTNPAPAIIARNRQQLAINLPIFMGSGVANETFLDLAGAAAEGVMLPCGKIHVAASLSASDPQRKILTEYAEEFKKRFKHNADPFGGHAWDSLQIIAAALKRSGGDPIKLRDEIEATRKFVGIGGIFNFTATDHNGITEEAAVMLRVDDGQYKLLWK